MICREIALLITLALGLLVAPLTAEAQPLPRVHRVGLLSASAPRPEYDALAEALRQGLRNLGYVEGQNLVLEVRYAAGSQERLRDLAAELVRLPVEVLVAPGAAAIRTAQQATRTIPIVMVGSYDPVVEGFVASLAQPGGNVTGLSFLQIQLPQKRLEFLKEAVPHGTRIAVLWSPRGPGYESRQPLLHNLAVAARALALHLHVAELDRADELDRAFVGMTAAGAEALMVLEDALLIGPLRGRIAELAVQHRLPAMCDWRHSVAAGCLMAYGTSQPDIYRRAATYVDKILKGAKPADLPVEQPTTFELVINLKTAKALGLMIPPTLLFQADEVLR
jgi:putative tryptophan/tyrosine transport system substrate-binding protein